MKTPGLPAVLPPKQPEVALVAGGNSFMQLQAQNIRCFTRHWYFFLLLLALLAPLTHTELSPFTGSHTARWCRPPALSASPDRRVRSQGFKLQPEAFTP